MQLTINQALKKGIAAYKEGKLQEAERIYRTILKARPKHAEANHNLGVIMASANKFEAALPFFEIAVDVNPKVEHFWVSYIDALIKENRFKDAKLILKQGKKREIRRIFRSLKIKLYKLHRVSFGGVNIGGLKESEFRLLDKKEVNQLKMGITSN